MKSPRSPLFTLANELSFRPERSAVEKPATLCATIRFGLLLILLTLSPPARAQGCTLCRDNTAATSPATQRAYRRAIILMSSAAAGLFLTTLIILKRQP